MHMPKVLLRLSLHDSFPCTPYLHRRQRLSFSHIDARSCVHLSSQRETERRYKVHMDRYERAGDIQVPDVLLLSKTIYTIVGSGNSGSIFSTGIHLFMASSHKLVSPLGISLALQRSGQLPLCLCELKNSGIWFPLMCSLLVFNLVLARYLVVHKVLSIRCLDMNVCHSPVSLSRVVSSTGCRYEASETNYNSSFIVSPKQFYSFISLDEVG